MTDDASGKKIGNYTVVHELGRGAMGIVYLARDNDLPRLVAIKVPRRDCVGSSKGLGCLFEEACAQAGLKHSSIIPIYHLGRTEDGMPFIVMEYIEGRSLEKMLQFSDLPHACAADLIAQIVEPVHYVHKQGFVLRDLKPANILLDLEGKPWAADFGLAIHESNQRLRAGEKAGTLAYMAPEQLRGETHRLDGRTDIWALGVMLYEMLTTRQPFDGDCWADVADEILNREPRPPRQIDDTIPAELERICLKCLSKEVTGRYTTAGDLAKDLRRWQQPRRSFHAMLCAAALALVVILSPLAVGHLGPARDATLPDVHDVEVRSRAIGQDCSEGPARNGQRVVSIKSEGSIEIQMTVAEGYDLSAGPGSP